MCHQQLQSFGLSASMEDLHTSTHTMHAHACSELSRKELFRDPSHNRSSKRTFRLNHKFTEGPLWMGSPGNPSLPTHELADPVCGFAAEQPASTTDHFSPSLIWACSKNKDLSRGTRLHNELQKRGLLEKHYSDALITMYAKCGELQKAQALADIHNCRNIIPWTALIAGYARKGQGQNALECFEKLQRKGISPDATAFACILKACAKVGAIDKGRQIHDEISRQGLLEQDVVLGGALVDMYAKCGALTQAQSVLKKLPLRNVVCWSALITGYAQKGQGKHALECFEDMQREGIIPDVVTYASILKACAVVGALDKGKQIHDEISRQGLLEHSIVLGGALVDMYAKCGALCQAESVLEKLPSRNVVLWNALIVGYVQKGQGEQAVGCLKHMQREGIRPVAVTYVCILKACAMIGAIDMGKQIHDEILRQGLLEHSVVLGNALVDMYAKCGALSQAQSVLEKLPSRDVVSWKALIAGYAQEGQGLQALECLEQMQDDSISPDAVTYLCMLKACAGIGAIDKGKLIHDEILRQGLLDHSLVLGNALVDMYAKCGALCQAQSVLEKFSSCSIVSWNALISGYGKEGQGEQALKCFDQMLCEGILPNMVTFHCLLNLCSHLGLVEKGQQLFDEMGITYGSEADLECFACMVDLLGRAGQLAKAAEVIQKMPFSATSEIWHCLLGACRIWVDVSLGTWAFEQAVELDICDGAAYVLMVNIYAAACMPQKAKDIEAMRIKNKAWKQQGCSWTTSTTMVDEFHVDDASHRQIKGNNLKLDDVTLKMSQENYRLNLKWGSQDLFNATTPQFPWRHSKKLAVASALISCIPTRHHCL